MQKQIGSFIVYIWLSLHLKKKNVSLYQKCKNTSFELCRSVTRSRLLNSTVGKTWTFGCGDKYLTPTPTTLDQLPSQGFLDSVSSLPNLLTLCMCYLSLTSRSHELNLFYVTSRSFWLCYCKISFLEESSLSSVITRPAGLSLSDAKSFLLTVLFGYMV